MKINKKEFFLNLEKVFTVVSLILYSGGPLTVILSGGASEGDGVKGSKDTTLILLLFMLIYLITALLLLCRWRKTLFILSQVKYSWFILFLAIASITWSSDPKLTTTRCVALLGTTLFGMYFATRYSIKEQLQLTTWMFGVAIVLSILFAVGLPKYGIMGGKHSGTLRGIYTHKNVLGKVMVLAGANILLSAIANKKHRQLLGSIFSLSLVCVIMTRSSSSMINFLNLIFISFVLRVFRFPFNTIPPTLSGISLISLNLYLFIQSNLAALLASIGKDPTLTGRGDLWPLVIDKIWERPWLGYGFSGFWLGLNGPSASVWADSGWDPPNSHNGFLDLSLDLGLLGLLIFSIGFITTFFKSINYVRVTNTVEGLWPSICLIYLLMINLSETSLLVQNNMFWIFYVAAEVSLVVISNPKNKFIYS